MSRRLMRSVSLLALAGFAASLASVSASAAVDEIVITATKRSTTLQDTALAVSAFTSESLENIGATEFLDYARFVPGLSVTDTGASRKKYVIRGVQSEIGAGDSASTVGQYLDEVPVTAFGVNQPDPLLYDVERVEVLRGPQGTLFGASSMGGTIRTLTKQPDASSFAASVEGTLSSTNEGGENYAANGMVNLPLGEKAALRGVLSYEDYSGFVDNVALGLSDVNSSSRLGGRLIFRLQPTEALDVSAMYMKQKSDIDGAWRTDVASGELKQATSVLEPYKDDLNIYNVKIEYDFGVGTLTSATSYFDRNDTTEAIDQEYTYAFGFIGPLGPGAFASGDRESDGIAEELRFVSNLEGPFQFVLGVFYNESTEQSVQDLFDPAGLVQADFPTAPAGTSDPLFASIVDKEFKDLSVFGEVSFQLTETLEATIGARHFEMDYDFTETITVSPEYLGAPPVEDYPPTILGAEADGTNMKYRLTWQPDDDHMVYFDASEGFRRGGTNIAHSFRPFVPESYDPDSLWSYELGFKTSWLDDSVVVNGALYRIDWSDIQIKTLLSGDNGFGGTAYAFGVLNAGDARIHGLEIETVINMSENFDFGATVNLMDGELIKDGGGSYAYRGLDGDKLPGDADIQFSAFVEYTRPIRDDMSLWMRGDISYLDDRITELRDFGLDVGGDINYADPNPNFFTMDSYYQINLRAGLRGESWEIVGFVNNLTDERADQLFFTPFSQLEAGPQKITIRPRTLGLTLRRSF